mmetsp:Transcript_46290/g.117481  ORF Transcript_46290/g.117481 Transcript_46290/m.117481 type:complete len:360 (-) Transcript_46290:356-1435(-)
MQREGPVLLAPEPRPPQAHDQRARHREAPQVLGGERRQWHTDLRLRRPKAEAPAAVVAVAAELPQQALGDVPNGHVVAMQRQLQRRLGQRPPTAATAAAASGAQPSEGHRVLGRERRGGPRRRHLPTAADAAHPRRQPPRRAAPLAEVCLQLPARRLQQFPRTEQLFPRSELNFRPRERRRLAAQHGQMNPKLLPLQPGLVALAACVQEALEQPGVGWVHDATAAAAPCACGRQQLPPSANGPGGATGTGGAMRSAGGCRAAQRGLEPGLLLGTQAACLLLKLRAPPLLGLASPPLHQQLLPEAVHRGLQPRAVARRCPRRRHQRGPPARGSARRRLQRLGSRTGNRRASAALLVKFLL